MFGFIQRPFSSIHALRANAGVWHEVAILREALHRAVTSFFEEEPLV